MGPPVARSAANPWAPGFENVKTTSPTKIGPTAARVLPKLVSSKSLTECCEGPNEKKYVGSFLD